MLRYHSPEESGKPGEELGEAVVKHQIICRLFNEDVHLICVHETHTYTYSRKNASKNSVPGSQTFSKAVPSHFLSVKIKRRSD